ncbi:MAG: F0F1 ATP synthase subunit delta [Methylococcaceae bacterium]|nr:F0F1 ATP synthase subunit delta [Methylococcaceae bacterium]
MELNWSTFLLEIVNFLVLVWILKIFLYRPVLETLARRQAGIDQTLTDAQSIRNEAEALKVQYESRLSQWSAEREAGRENLRREIAEERERLLAILQAELERDKEKARVLEEKLRADCLRKYQETCLEQGVRFVAKLLSDLSSPELETRLFDLALAQMENLPEDRINAIRLACEEAPEEANVLTAYPLDGVRRQNLAAKLGVLVGMPVSCRFDQEADLLAGLRVTLGPWVFHANLRDELKAFAEPPHEPG